MKDTPDKIESIKLSILQETKEDIQKMEDGTDKNQDIKTNKAIGEENKRTNMTHTLGIKSQSIVMKGRKRKNINEKIKTITSGKSRDTKKIDL